MKNSAELASALSEAGLDRVTEKIVGLARPCCHIRRTLTPEEQIPTGASKFGGSPDVPAGFAWPHIEGHGAPEAMEFVAQVRLADVPAPLPEPVPRSGLLSFFTRWDEGRVFYYPEGTRLQRTPGPNPPVPPAPSGFWQRVRASIKANPDPRHTYRACAIAFSPGLSPVDGGSSTFDTLKLSEGDSEAYIELCESSWNDAPKHQLFGHASPVQNEMELECDFHRRGEKERWDLPPERFIAAARDWVLLMQVDSDDGKDGPGWMWGDLGIVYFWIHREDLKAGAFDKVISIGQCH
jgi:uncharacterized protein YwqG